MIYYLNKMDYYLESLKLHEKHKSKLEVKLKVPAKTKEDLSLAYTPGVAEPCKKIHENPDSAYKYTWKQNCVAVVSDGSAVLGLGNIGGMASFPVMEGKCLLLKEFGGVDAVPICLDTQDTEEIIAAVKAIAPTFGGINLEDIKAPKCFEIERRLKEELSIPVFHDDQHGTAIVALAGLINALKVTNRTAAESKVVISGAGAAGISISNLLLRFGFEDLVLVDRTGIIHKDRVEGMNPYKLEIAKKSNPRNLTGDRTDAMKGADILLGVSGPGVVTKEMVESMNDDAIVIAMANPIPEIMPDLAKEAGAAIVATGRSDFPNQVNNVLAFPGLFRGILDARGATFTEDMFIAAAEAIASLVENPTTDKIVPDLFDERVAQVVAKAVEDNVIDSVLKV